MATVPYSNQQAPKQRNFGGRGFPGKICQGKIIFYFLFFFAKARNYLRPFLKRELHNSNRAYIRYDKLVIAGTSYEYDPEVKDIVHVER